MSVLSNFRRQGFDALLVQVVQLEFKLLFRYRFASEQFKRARIDVSRQLPYTPLEAFSNFLVEIEKIAYEHNGDGHHDPEYQAGESFFADRRAALAG